MRKLILILTVLIFAGCNHNNPVQPITSDTTYLGLPNTTREYTTTTYWYQPNTDIPYLTVPDSLYGKVSFDSAQIAQGKVGYRKYQEVVIPYDTSCHSLTNYDSSIIYRQIKHIDEEYIDLNTELEYALRGEIFPGYSPGSYIDGSVQIENPNKFYIQLYDSSQYIVLRKPLMVGAEWIRGRHNYKKEDGTDASILTECKVLSREIVTVKAGNFFACKIEVDYDWPDLNSKTVGHYEYYTPGIGLILFESDSNVHITTIGEDHNSSIYLRQKIRQELVSYNFVSD